MAIFKAANIYYLLSAQRLNTLSSHPKSVGTNFVSRLEAIYPLFTLFIRLCLNYLMMRAVNSEKLVADFYQPQLEI